MVYGKIKGRKGRAGEMRKEEKNVSQGNSKGLLVLTGDKLLSS